MPRTTEQVLRDQEEQAAADLARPRAPMPPNLTAAQRQQWEAWGWCDWSYNAKRKWFPAQQEGRTGACSGVANEGETKMALGKRKSSAAAFDPILKFDARNGTITRCDRVQENGEWVTKPVGISPDNFEAAFDMANMKIGWLCFSPPDFKLFSVGEDIGDQPTGNHKEGFKVRLQLRNDAGEGVFEMSSTAAALWTSMDELHDDWQEAKAKAKGKLPVVGISEMIRVEGRSGTTYRPSFEITGWAAVPELAAK
jgi:hypothetical protein